MEKNQLSFWYFAFALVALLVLQNIINPPQTETLSYSEFKMLMKASKVNDLVLTEQEIRGTMASQGLETILPREKVEALKKVRDGELHFVTIRVNDPPLVQELDTAKVRYAGKVESKWLGAVLSWVLPLLLFIAVRRFAMKRKCNGRSPISFSCTSPRKLPAIFCNTWRAAT